MHDAGGRRQTTGTRPAGRPDICRVLVAGGRQLLRDGIRALLEQRSNLHVVGAVGDGLAARAVVAAGDADVVVTHAFLGDAAGGAALAVALREESPATGVVLLLGDGDAEEVHTVLEHGTQGRALLLMDHPRCAEELPRAVAEVRDGGSVVHAGVVDVLLRARTTAAAGTLDGLTPREREVLRGIATGASNHGIATQLGMSERAVEKHINQLYGKLDLRADAGVHRRVAAALRLLAAPGD